jgi:HSP20 family protein
MSDPTTKSDRRELVDREFHNLRELFEMLMSEMTPSDQKLKMRPNLGWAPPTDVYETETELIVTMDIAGMDRRDISVVTDGSIITIRGMRNEIAPQCKKQFHKMEIQVGPFQRLISVPVTIETNSVFTNYANGLLEVRFRKSFDKPDKKKIEVE